ncbi:hypothetical protein, partial [Actinomadura flavalba]|uniref:hypothetical protein n=1 Tax=Actinomadura flavalba TaxID=1120938 RepID=UPI00196A1676
ALRVGRRCVSGGAACRAALRVGRRCVSGDGILNGRSVRRVALAEVTQMGRGVPVWGRWAVR